MDKKLNIINTEFKDLYIVYPNIHEDIRGTFSRLFCEEELNDIMDGSHIKQINYSNTKKKGSIRGLHYQYPPNIETKIVQCIKGKILDIIVDLRKDSNTFLKTFTIELSEHNHKMLIIPKGFAHGFQTLEDNCTLLYFHTELYSPNNEGAINIKDPAINLKLPLNITDISNRDIQHPCITKDFKGI